VRQEGTFLVDLLQTCFSAGIYGEVVNMWLFYIVFEKASPLTRSSTDTGVARI
jgi:hypothetical protein